MYPETFTPSGAYFFAIFPASSILSKILFPGALPNFINSAFAFGLFKITLAGETPLAVVPIGLGLFATFLASAFYFITFSKTLEDVPFLASAELGKYFLVKALVPIPE